MLPPLLQAVDIYLLDQAMKGRISSAGNILDAGCGSGRNFAWLAAQGLDITAFDPNDTHIEALKMQYPAYAERLHCATIQTFDSIQKFDFIICNAVLHFAENHIVFEQQFAKLTHLLQPNGVLFIRMACDIGIALQIDANGRALLPDESTRYVLTTHKLNQILLDNDLILLEPFKAVWVAGLRAMATLVMRKKP